MYEKLLAVPDIVEIVTSDGVLDTSGVSAGNEVSDTTVNTRRCVPHNLGGATIVHGRRPDSEDSVFSRKGTVFKESSVLLHAVVKRDIVVLAPASKRVEKQDRVSVASGNELLTSVLEEEDVTIVKRVPDLESVHNISISFDDLGLDLRWGHSELIVTIIESRSLNEAHGFTGDEEFALSEDSLGARVVLRHAAESASADLLLTVVEEDRSINDSENIIGADGRALESDLAGTSESLLLLSSHRLSDRNREEVALALSISDGLHVHDLEELELVHEAVERCGPAVTNSLKVLNLVLVNVQNGEVSKLLSLLIRGISPVRLSDDTLLVRAHDTILLHVVDNHGLASIKRKRASVDVHGGVSRGFIRSRDTGEVGDNSITSLLVETLDITTLTNLEGSADVALEELEASSLVDGLGKVSVSTVR